MKVQRIVDSNTKSINPCEAQHERKYGEIERSKDTKKNVTRIVKINKRNKSSRFYGCQRF